MKAPFLILLLLFGYLANAQLSETLLNKVRHSTDEFYLSRDTLSIVGTKSLPCLEVKINGKGSYNFLIDLGSNVLLIKQSVVNKSSAELLLDFR